MTDYLPLPLSDQKHVIQTHRDAAVRLRASHPDWIRDPKATVQTYVRALTGKDPLYRMKTYINVQDGDEHIIHRSEVLADAYRNIKGTGDADNLPKAERTAALHVILQLIAQDGISSDMLPTSSSQGLSAASGSQQAYPQNGSTGSATPLYSNNIAYQAEPSPSAPAAPMELPTGANARSALLEAVNNAPLQINMETGREFMDWYCKKFNFQRPDLAYKGTPMGGSTQWTAILSVDGKPVGAGRGPSKRDCTSQAYIDACVWLAKCDPPLWKTYEAMQSQRKQSDNTRELLTKAFPRADFTPAMEFRFSERMDEKLRDVIWESRNSELYKKAVRLIAKQRELIRKVQQDKQALALVKGRGRETDGRRHSSEKAGAAGAISGSITYEYDPSFYKSDLTNKSAELRSRLDDYRNEPRHAKMRRDRAALPVYAHAEDFLAQVEQNPVLVLMAQTGSGKTTQVPQIILDDWISKGKGGECNIICTQPRRLAAISVSQRIAAERGEQIGDSVGYQVRFEYKPPKPDGTISFCTTGIFLRRLQMSIEDTESNSAGSDFLENVTHVIADEVHERDIDVDLLLFVLRRRLEERAKRGKAGFKVILMSATIDPTLFCTYFIDPKTKTPCPTVQIPGRTFEVKKHYLNEIVAAFTSRRIDFGRGAWVFEDKDVKAYLERELKDPLPREVAERTDDNLKLPSPLIALTIALVAEKTRQTRDGHILVFLPGLDEIRAVQRILLDRQQPLLDVDFDRYEIHILHSAIPVAEQQAVFSPAEAGLQRIILATNIAETSVTIPDVVYVVDAGKCKEKRFDPERHLSSLVSAFTGVGNMMQRAGRAGRHRPGEYFSIVSSQRMAVLPQNQTVEMKRLDLSNVVMHVKGLNLPLEVEDVLDLVIEPPEHQRVVSAIKALEQVGALDSNKNLTSLGRVLLQLPVEAAIGKLTLLGCFFRCLEQAVTIAAILTNRDPFVCPLDKRREANAAKLRFAPNGFMSDILAVLKAFNEWSSVPDGYERRMFCDENFLSGSTLRLIQQVRDHLIQSLNRSGALKISGGGRDIYLQRNALGRVIIPAELNVNGQSLPLLTALIATAVAPNFAIRKTAMLLRTPQDPAAVIHPSSLLSTQKSKKLGDAGDQLPPSKRQVYAYAEATRNVSQGDAKKAAKQDSMLRGITLLDPLGLLLFGVHQLSIVRDGFKCDSWLPVSGNVSALDDLERFKDALQLSLLRVFEGLGVAMTKQRQLEGGFDTMDANEPEENEVGDESLDSSDPTLSDAEIRDLDQLTKNVVEVLNMHAMDNGLPAFAEIARKPNYMDDEPAYDSQYGSRRREDRGTGDGHVGSYRATRSGDEIYAAGGGSGDDGWGDWGTASGQGTPKKKEATLIPTQIPARPVPKAAGDDWSEWGQTHQANGSALPSHAIQMTSISGAATRSTPKTSQATDDDAWASYSVVNDAYERRAALSRGESLRSPAARPSSPKPAQPLYDGTTLQSAGKLDARPPEPAADDGWGSWQPTTANNDAFERRAALARGEVLSPLRPALISAPAPAEQLRSQVALTSRDRSASTTMMQAVDHLIAKNGWNSSRPPSRNAGQTSRLLSVFNAPSGPDNLHSGWGDPGTEQPRSQPGKPGPTPDCAPAADDGWGNWTKPDAEQAGAEAYRRRQALSSNANGHTNGAAASPASYAAVRPNYPLAEESRRARSPSPPAAAGEPADDGWLKYTPSAAASKEAELAYQRRAVMSAQSPGSNGSSTQHEFRVLYEEPGLRPYDPALAFQPPPAVLRPKAGAINIRGSASKQRISSSSASSGTSTLLAGVRGISIRGSSPSPTANGSISSKHRSLAPPTPIHNETTGRE